MIIHGSDINLAALSEVKSLSDLKKLKIFSHLPNEEEANDDLWKTIKPGVPVKIQKLAEDSPDDGND